MKKANAEGWANLRKDADSKSVALAQQKTADAAADNAVIAREIQRDLLERIKRISQKYPHDATEVRQQKDGKTMVYKLTDLTRAYKDVMDYMPRGQEEADDPLLELFRRMDEDAQADVQP